MDIDYENKDKGPILQWSDDGGATWEPLEEKETITLTLDDSLIIRIENDSDYDPGSIVWICDQVPVETNTQLNIRAGTAPFAFVKEYSLTVEGTIDGKPYTTSVFIKVDT